MPLSAGTNIGSYRIAAPLGAGGMGEVYRARDTKLGRDVALKVLPESLADNADYMARFHREAQVLASLNHPHIASIHGLEESGGMRALVMELVEGPTLADRIRKGPLRLEEALGVAKQIAEALEYAHEKGVVHRDLKPANVKLTPEGAAKVLDFGLAKVAEPAAGAGSWEDAPTLPGSGSHPGLIAGTPAYMAPEQARGEAVDKRADIWAFGVVLLEMLTGHRMFQGETTGDTLAAVLTKDPDWGRLPARTPPSIRKLLKRCLERDRKRRLQAIGDARIEIEECSADPGGEAVSVRHSILPWVPSVALLIALAALALVHLREAPPESPHLTFTIPPPEKTEFMHAVPSPDGRHIAFTTFSESGYRLWVRDVDSLTMRLVPGSEGALLPFWSPDSRSLGFWAEGKLKKVELMASSEIGPLQTICTAPRPGGAAWSRDGLVIFSDGSSLHRVSANGGDVRAVTSLDQSRHERAHRWPVLLPDGRHLLYTVDSEQTESEGIFIGSVDSAEKKRLLDDRSNASYATVAGKGGYVLFVRGGVLMAQPFDAGRLELSGEPRPITQKLTYSSGWLQGAYAISNNGMLVFRTGGVAGHSRLTLHDRTGKQLATVGEPGQFSGPIRLSPDGKQAAVVLEDPDTHKSHIWLVDLARGFFSRLRNLPSDETDPVWSPDGLHIVFSTNRQGTYDLSQKDVNGTGDEQVLLKSNRPLWATDWSPDGRYLLYDEDQDTQEIDRMWILPLSGERKPVPVPKTAMAGSGVFSPDGV